MFAYVWKKSKGINNLFLFLCFLHVGKSWLLYSLFWGIGMSF